MWEVLPGLLGEGPMPLHYHAGHPTPWTEGLVVRFANKNGIVQVGNFQRDGGTFSQVKPWPATGSLAVVASGALYFVSLSDPRIYTPVPAYVVGLDLSPSGDVLFVAEYGRMLGFRNATAPAWEHRWPAATAVVIDRVGDDSIEVSVQDELEMPWLQARLSAVDGSVLWSSDQERPPITYLSL